MESICLRNRRNPVQIRRWPTLGPQQHFYPLAQRILNSTETHMDYSQFLQPSDAFLELPYFGGNSVCDDTRTYRIRGTLAPGWYRFRLCGRFLTKESAVEAKLDAWNLPRVSGYIFSGRLFTNDSRARIFGMPSDAGLQPFTLIAARKWFDGNILFYGQEFDSEAEPLVRQAFEEEKSIEQVKAVSPALAHVFLLESTQRALAHQKREREQRKNELARWQQTLEGRISLALSHTGAELVSWRQIDRGQAAVRYRFGDRRFECIIDTGSLQILDAGICLSGADEELNLSSLPSAVREAVQTGQLHVFRRG